MRGPRAAASAAAGLGSAIHWRAMVFSPTRKPGPRPERTSPGISGPRSGTTGRGAFAEARTAPEAGAVLRFARFGLVEPVRETARDFRARARAFRPAFLRRRAAGF